MPARSCAARCPRSNCTIVSPDVTPSSARWRIHDALAGPALRRHSASILASPPGGIPARSGRRHVDPRDDSERRRQTPAGMAVAIDLASLDVCAIVIGRPRGLTADTGLATDESSDRSRRSVGASGASTRTGVPQYLDVSVLRAGQPRRLRPQLGRAITCPSTAVPCVECRGRPGGVCTGPARSGWPRWTVGVAVQVIVNEPESALDPRPGTTPANAVIAGLE